MMKKLITNLGFVLVVAILFIAPNASADTATEQNVTVEQCANVQVKIKGFGAGLMYQPRPIAVAGEHISLASISQKCAVVSWITDMPATSQVIFAEADATVNMDATKENLGFPMATKQNNSAYVRHDAILHDLTPGKMYIYRVVSRSHPAAIPTVSEAHMLYIPKILPVVTPPVTTTPVTESSTTTAPTTHYATVPVTAYVSSASSVKSTETKQANSKETVTNVKDLLYATTTTLVATTSTSTADLDSVPAAITAVNGTNNDNDGKKTSFWQRLKKAFSFFGAKTTKTTENITETAPDSVNNDQSASSKEEGVVIDASSFIARVGFLIPTLFILLFIYLIQQIALPMLGVIVERPLVFWMFSVIVVAVAAGLLKYYQITLTMIAIFLGLIAWYLLTEASNEVNGKSKDKSNDTEKLEAKTA